MKTVRISATRWASEDDVYADLLTALGAPQWHRRDLDAIWDSVTAGDVNRVGPPLRIVVTDASRCPDPARALLDRAQNLFHDLAGSGVEVEMVLQSRTAPPA